MGELESLNCLFYLYEPVSLVSLEIDAFSCFFYCNESGFDSCESCFAHSPWFLSP